MRMDADSNEEGRKDGHGAPDYDATGYDAADYHDPGDDAADYGEPGCDPADDDQPGYDPGYGPADDDQPGYDAGDDGGPGYDAAGYDAAGYDAAGYDAAEYQTPGYRGPDDGDGGDWEPSDDGTFWRRRFLILCGGAVAVAVCAWLFPGAHAAPARTSPAARASMDARIRAQALPPAATGAAWGVTPPAKPSAPPGPGATTSGLGAGTAPAKLAATAKEKVSHSYHPGTSPAGSPTPAGSPKGTPPAKGTAAGKGADSAKAPGSGAGAAACVPADVVLSLFTSKPAYAAGERPTFSVYAVSTSPKACTLRYGPGTVKVVVTRHGRVVWDSAACHPPAAKRVRFTLGVPQVLKLSWNRKATGPGGCAGALPASGTGTLDAVAVRGSMSSPVAKFTVTK